MRSARFFSAIAPLFLVLLVLSACSPDDDGVASPDPSPEAASNFVAAAAEAEAGALAWFLGWMPDDAEVESMQRRVTGFPSSSYSSIECDLESRTGERVVYRCVLTTDGLYSEAVSEIVFGKVDGEWRVTEVSAVE